MLNVRQDFDATDGDGVRDKCNKEFCLITFYFTGKVFKMNDFVSAEMKAISDCKGSLIQ